MALRQYNTISARILRPIIVCIILLGYLKVIHDRTEGFYGITTELDDSDVQAYSIFAILIALWLIYELVLSIRFFVKKK
jgi:hypothetical protein